LQPALAEEIGDFLFGDFLFDDSVEGHELDHDHAAHFGLLRMSRWWALVDRQRSWTEWLNAQRQRHRYTAPGPGSRTGEGVLRGEARSPAGRGASRRRALRVPQRPVLAVRVIWQIVRDPH